MEDWITIRNLKHNNPKLGTREIAKIAQVSRNTVKGALASEEIPEYKREEKINPAILPFESISMKRFMAAVRLVASYWKI